MRSVRLIDPLLFNNIAVQKKKIIRVKKKWNVFLIIMESTGMRYIFDTSRGNRLPMPFLKHLSDNSLFLINNYAVSNSSPRSIFSILSGIYPNARPRYFSQSKRNRIPSFVSFLDRNYDSFFINPASVKYYFPIQFLRKSGLTELYGYYNLPIKGNIPHPKGGRNEIATVNFFLKRLSRAKEPFFALYYSYAPHHPYFDYGKKYEILPDKTKWLHRYYNNLYLLDCQIKRMVNNLKKTGRLKNTIIVITGDHSEAFGQHPKNWIHSLATYNENIKVPTLFYHPILFRPKKFTGATSHVDILPTLLDAMGITYNDKLFQGESLYQKKLRRKYVFVYGNENTVSSISRSNIKLQMSFKYNRCWALDLKNDPQEKKKLECSRFPEQEKATELFRYYQPKILKRYNKSCLRKKSFYGEKHP